MGFGSWQAVRGVTSIRGFRDPEFDYQLLRTMGLAVAGGSSIGECLAAATAVADGDTAAWTAAFGDLADRVEQVALGCLAEGHLVSARDALFRASTYHRVAANYAEGDPHALMGRVASSRRCFEQAASLCDPPVEVLEIPYLSGATLPGFMVQPANGRHNGATVVAVGGFDSSAEELYFALGPAGATRGWRVVVFDGPGQLACMRLDPGCTFRPDGEVPIGAVLDYLDERGDAGWTAVVGSSFGGYFAARAAARDRRLGALVCDIPVVDLGRYFEALLGPALFASEQDLRPEDVAGVPEDLMPKQMAWGIVAACRRFGASSFQDWKRIVGRFRLDADASIDCPVLAMYSEYEGDEVARQADALARVVDGELTVRRFGVEGGADAHCQVGNLSLAAQVVYDWLDDRYASAQGGGSL